MRKIIYSKWAGIAACAAACAVTPLLLPAGQAHAANMDKFIGLPSSNIVLATSHTSNSKDMPIYKSASTKSKVIAKLQGRSCVVADMSGMKKGTDYTFVKVKLPNCSPSYGYVKASQFLFGKIDTSRFGLSSASGKNAKRISACKYSLKFLGTKYSYANSKTKGMCCNQLLNKCYRNAGYNYSAGSAAAYNNSKYGKRTNKANLKAGDIVFYRGINGGNHNHVGMYLGGGYVIQSTCDKGKTYPRAGVRITKLTFRSTPTDYRNPFK